MFYDESAFPAIETSQLSGSNYAYNFSFPEKGRKAENRRRIYEFEMLETKISFFSPFWMDMEFSGGRSSCKTGK